MSPDDVTLMDFMNFSSKMIGDVVVTVRNADGTPNGYTVTSDGVARGNLPAILPASRQAGNVCSLSFPAPTWCIRRSNAHSDRRCANGGFVHSQRCRTRNSLAYARSCRSQSEARTLLMLNAQNARALSPLTRPLSRSCAASGCKQAHRSRRTLIWATCRLLSARSR